MNKTKLHAFVTNIAGKNRITFGDVRRLQRDYLPGGVSSREEAEILIHLDAKVRLADRAWTDWLAAAIVDFAVSTEWPIVEDKGGSVAWLKGVLAATCTSTRAGRRIVRELRREVARIQLMASFPSKKNIAASQAALPGLVEGAMNELQLAA